MGNNCCIYYESNTCHDSRGVPSPPPPHGCRNLRGAFIFQLVKQVSPRWLGVEESKQHQIGAFPW